MNKDTEKALFWTLLFATVIFAVVILVLTWSVGRMHRENRILRLRGEPMLLDVGNPNSSTSSKVKMKALSEEPWIVELTNFLNKDECNHLIKLGENAKMKQSMVGTTFEDSKSDYDSRNSFTSFLLKSQDEIVKRIENRCSLLANHPTSHIEPFQIVRYQPGQFFKEHHDYFEPKEGDKFVPQYQRTLTIFIYLNDVAKDEKGGQTYFPSANLSVRPQMGKAVMFRNITPDGKEDPKSLHSGQKLMKSTKYGCNVWFTSHPYKPPSPKKN